MLSDRQRLAASDIVKHAGLAIGYAADRADEQIFEDYRSYLAIVRCLEIVSEASRRLPDDFKTANALIPWREIANAGNVYRHNYDGLVPERVVLTVRQYLPELMLLMQKALGEIL